MEPWRKRWFWHKVRIIGAGALVLSALTSRGEDFGLELSGGRFGFPGDSRSSTFEQAECYCGWSLPWDWDFAEDWYSHWRLDLTTGWLGGHSEDAFITSIGPTVVFNYVKCPISMEVGLSPTYVTRHDFGPTDLGSLFQFTTHAQLNWNIGEHIQISYRYQHMSNGGINHPNPGLNLQFLGIGYRF